MEKKLFIKTYGCQMNVYDSVKMQNILSPFGYSTTEDIKEADMVILNTCHIREKASEKMYSELGRIKQIKDKRLEQSQKDMMIIVAGCVAQAEGEEIFQRTPYVNAVMGPQSYQNLLPKLVELENKEKIKPRKLLDLDFSFNEKFDKLPIENLSENASNYISIQEGCDKFCNFCVVPYTRGAEFSRPVEQIYRETLASAEKGTKEVVLLGQNVNAYHGLDYRGKQWSLAELISHIATIPSIQRIRYTTSHPINMTDDLIALHGNERKLMPFLHLPVQSGSDKILKLMNRKHTREEYFLIIEKLRKACPSIGLSSDFIVGFPGETEEDFADTMDLVKRINYSGPCYSFAYDPRPGTPAATKEQLPLQVKKERLAILQQELKKQQQEFNKSFIGKIMPVLFNREGRHEGHIAGYSPYLQSIYLRQGANEQVINQIKNVKITNLTSNSLEGVLI